MKLSLKFSKLDDMALAPTRKHATDAGADVYSLNEVRISPFGVGIVRTGLAFHVPKDTMLLAKPKGGSNFLLGAGVVDTGFMGEILIKVVNTTPDEMVVFRGAPVAQLVLVPILTPPLEEVPQAELYAEPTPRADTGGIVDQNKKKEGNK